MKDHAMAKFLYAVSAALIEFAEGMDTTPASQELAPLPGTTAAPPPAVVSGCPVHHVAWRHVPAGTSQKTGKSYAAFDACPERGCNERPRP